MKPWSKNLNRGNENKTGQVTEDPNTVFMRSLYLENSPGVRHGISMDVRIFYIILPFMMKNK